MYKKKKKEKSLWAFKKAERSTFPFDISVVILVKYYSFRIPVVMIKGVDRLQV